MQAFFNVCFRVQEVIRGCSVNKNKNRDIPDHSIETRSGRGKSSFENDTIFVFITTINQGQI